MGTMSLDRREFVAAGAAAAVAAGTVATGAAYAEEPEWDREVDVVVGGSGMSLFASLYGHLSGLDVLVVEKNTFLGGAASFSGGGTWLPNNRFAQEYGDNREDAIATIKFVAEGTSTDELIEAFVDGCHDFVDWSYDELGFPWISTGDMLTGWDEYQTPNPRDIWHFSRSLNNAANKGDVYSGGPGMFKWLKDKVDEVGLPYMLETAITRLVSDENGSVVGVEAEGPDGVVRIKARRGVLLTTGGFDHDHTMMVNYQRQPSFNTICFPTNTGDGIKMGLELGADLAQMQSCWGCAVYTPVDQELSMDDDIMVSISAFDANCERGLPGSIIVNKYGVRFADESANYHTFNRAFAAWDAGSDHNCMNYPAYLIVDKGFTDNYPLPCAGLEVGVIPEGAVVADTLEELCEACGIDQKNFAWQLEQFNKFAEEGYDPQFHRGENNWDTIAPFLTGDWLGKREGLANPAMAPVVEPPFVAMKLWPGTLGTKGGLKTNGKAQVLKRDGSVIPNLYAAGGGANTPLGEGYPSNGGPLATGAVMSWIAMRDLIG